MKAGQFGITTTLATEGNMKDPKWDVQCTNRFSKKRLHSTRKKREFRPWRNNPSGPRRPYYRGFVITLRHTKLVRTPLDE